MRVGEPTLLDASLFIDGEPNLVRWSVVARDCDGVSSFPSYRLEDPTMLVARLTPGRPYPYRLRLEAGLGPDDVQSCEFDVPVEGNGLRVEACWTNDQEVDLDLYLHSPLNQKPFIAWQNFIDEFGDSAGSDLPTDDACNVFNCTPTLRMDFPRVDFGYPDSPLDECGSGPLTDDFLQQRICPNPRMSIDTNSDSDTLTGTSGFTERIQLDNPADGDTFRVMLHNFNNLQTTPFVFIYCNGVRTALLPPNEPPGFIATEAARKEQVVLGYINSGPGLMWRPVDITTHITQQQLSCEITQLTDPSHPERPYVTLDDPSY
jgi:hypothetical protein